MARTLASLVLVTALFGCAMGEATLSIDGVEITSSGHFIRIDQMGADDAYVEITIAPHDPLSDDFTIDKTLTDEGNDTLRVAQTVGEGQKVSLWRQVSDHVASFLGGIVTVLLLGGA